MKTQTLPPSRQPIIGVTASGGDRSKGSCGLILNLHIQPGAKKTVWAGAHGEAQKIRLMAPPVDGKANAALLAFVAASLNVPPRTVTLLSGLASRQKRVQIMVDDENTLNDVWQRLYALTSSH